MFFFNDLNIDEVERFGKRILYDYQKRLPSFEAAAQQCVQDIYQQFVTSDEAPAFALVRIFRASKYSDLAPELVSLVDNTRQNQLVLMGTSGLEPAWCDRRQSQKRQVIPIGAGMSPMFKGIFQEFGFQWDDNTGDIIPRGAITELAMAKYFYIPQAGTSSYITDQETFVNPYNIQSVIALGSPFLSGAAYTLICFSHEYISQETARKFASLTTYLSTLLAFFDKPQKFWGV